MYVCVCVFLSELDKHKYIHTYIHKYTHTYIHKYMNVLITNCIVPPIKTMS